MKIYLDTGNVHDINEAALTGLVDGVTTNPTLIAKEGNEFIPTVKKIIDILDKFSGDSDFTVSAEVTKIDHASDMIKQGQELAKINPHILVKVPLTSEGLKAVKVLSSEGIRCNVTLCFSAAQALLAAKSGAWCVSPFIGRIDDEGYEGRDLIEDIREIYDRYGFETKILAASIRSSHHVYESMKCGADIATIPVAVFKKMFYNPLTDNGIKQFEKDWEEYELNLKKKNKK